MKHLFTFLVFFCTATTFAQQVVVQVIYINSQQSSNKNLIYYQHSQLLSITDFTKIPDEANSAIAITSSGFAFKAGIKKETDKPTLLLIQVDCSFDKTQSWMKPAGKNAYTLNHEQRHFDISFISCMQFIHQLKKFNFDEVTALSQIKQLYQKSLDDMSRLQQQYDSETQNGINQQQQQNWNKKIDELLLISSQ
jgi:hypothetical protein